jgi:hypothetical protein
MYIYFSELQRSNIVGYVLTKRHAFVIKEN